MIRRLSFALLAVAITAGFAMAQQGNWKGQFTNADWQNRTLRAQIVGESGVDYRAYIYVGEKDGPETRGIVKGKTQKGGTFFQGDIDLGEKFGGVFTLDGNILKGVFSGELQSKSGGANGVFTMERVYLQSPTLGQKPPAGAIILMMDQGATKEEQQALYAKQVEVFDGEWDVQKRWGVMGDGSIRMFPSSIESKKEFGDSQYHIEFKTPYMPNDRGQARGNSGVYVHGRYEIQVLDSFTDEPRDNQCGGIYQQAVPLSNPCLPPGEWQTYDITFRAPRFNSSGQKTENARLTVKLNGTVIHDNLELRHPTPGGRGGQEALTGILHLQDHNDYVSWKNIWVLPMD
ncbi:MAG: DUF1080 domain-containing protein [Candidatus Omnitrophica bacterium]|nr:DUF1080 domain-containing protein [Candidatus Omnitrophota bacterium]